MTKQQAYNKIRKWFSDPKHGFGYSEPTGCVYRGNANPRSTTRCAVGCLIPTMKYDSYIEGRPVTDLDLVKLGVASDRDNEEELWDFIYEAQGAHDYAARRQFVYDFDEGNAMPMFLRDLDDLAKRHGLTVPA